MRISFFLLGFLLSGISFAQTKNNDWENPAIVDQNKEKPHASFMLFDKKEDVAKDDYSRSRFYRSLNGTWKFLTHLFEVGRQHADKWLAENYDSIGVKGTVDLQARYL